MRVVDGRGVRMRLTGAATAAVAIMMIVTGCDTSPEQAASGPPRSTSQPAIGTAPQGHAFYAQAASYTGPNALAHARQQAQALRAKGFPATVYSSHTEFPSHTYYLFVAVSSGQFPPCSRPRPRWSGCTGLGSPTPRSLRSSCRSSDDGAVASAASEPRPAHCGHENSLLPS
jgi:hypothetical protein